MKTKFKREELIKMITDELDERYYYYSDFAIARIVDEWWKQKSPLIAILENHPNWNEENYMVEFDADIERSFNHRAIGTFFDWLWGSLCPTINWWSGEDNDKSKVLRKVRYFFQYQQIGTFLNSNIGTISKENGEKSEVEKGIDELNDLNEDFHLRLNMKTSKAIRKVCKEMGWDKIEDFDRRYAHLSDEINPLKIRRHTCISVHPLDFLLMSNGNSWTSCHYIGDDRGEAGEWSSGTISYMLDSTTMVFYTVSADYQGNEIMLEGKIQRQIFAFKEGALVQSRLYPQSNDGCAKEIYDQTRGIAQNVFASSLGVPNLWKVRRNNLDRYIERGIDGTCYEDWIYYNDCTISYLEGTDIEKFTDYNNKIIMGESPICISTGERHDYCNNIDSTYKGYVCCECGILMDEDDVIWIDGNPYCEDCVSYCDHCGEYVLRTEEVYVTGRYGTHSEYWCDYCIGNSAFRCDCCDEIWEFSSSVEVDGDNICPNCAEMEACVCYECGEMHYADNMYEAEWANALGELVCEDCFDFHKNAQETA